MKNRRERKRCEDIFSPIGQRVSLALRKPPQGPGQSEPAKRHPRIVQWLKTQTRFGSKYVGAKVEAISSLLLLIVT